MSLEKTKIIDLHRDYARFPGFRIKNHQRVDPVISYTRIRRDWLGQVRPVLIRQRSSWGLFFDKDHDRVTSRMKLKGLISKKGKPKRYATIEQLKEHEIVYKYRQML